MSATQIRPIRYKVSGRGREQNNSGEYVLFDDAITSIRYLETELATAEAELEKCREALRNLAAAVEDPDASSLMQLIAAHAALGESK